MKIGVLALQGAVCEYICHVESSSHEGIVVEKVGQLDEIDGLALPGGEFTILRRLMDLHGFKEKLQQSDLPVFGTCTGLIVLAKDVEGETGYMKELDITVARNSFGRQVDSFETELDAKGIAKDIEGVFIKAPYIVNAENNIEILSSISDKIVAVKQGECPGVPSHSELTDDYHITQYFVEHIVK